MVWVFFKTFFPLSIAIKKATNTVAFLFSFQSGLESHPFLYQKAFLKNEIKIKFSVSS
jgi:hypothetical protein